MAKPKRPPPDPEQQKQLRAALETMRSGLTGKATLLVRGLRPPRPEPAELVSETVRRVLARYVDSEIESASGLAFTILTRIACDIARKGRAFDGGFIDDDSAVPDTQHSAPDPFVRAALAKLSDKERCVVTRIAIEEEAVPTAFKLCKWDTPSPYPEYKKVLAKLKTHLEGSHE